MKLSSFLSSSTASPPIRVSYTLMHAKLSVQRTLVLHLLYSVSLYFYFFLSISSLFSLLPISHQLKNDDKREEGRKRKKQSPCRHISLLPSFSSNRRTAHIIIYTQANLFSKLKSIGVEAKETSPEATRKVYSFLVSF